MKGYEMMMYKPLAADKLPVFEKLYYEALQKFNKDADKTCEMVGVNDKHNYPETAALVVIANTMLNLDEVITKN